MRAVRKLKDHTLQPLHKGRKKTLAAQPDSRCLGGRWICPGCLTFVDQLVASGGFWCLPWLGDSQSFSNITCQEIRSSL